MHRANGTELTLKNVQPVDKGEYACQVRLIVIVVVMMEMMTMMAMEAMMVAKMKTRMSGDVVAQNIWVVATLRAPESDGANILKGG